MQYELSIIKSFLKYDEWYKWKCPNQRYMPTGYEHIYTNEWIEDGLAAEPCPMDFSQPGKEICTRCGTEFRHP